MNQLKGNCFLAKSGPKYQKNAMKHTLRGRKDGCSYGCQNREQQKTEEFSEAPDMLLAEGLKNFV
jgi:hypothetical protein